MYSLFGWSLESNRFTIAGKKNIITKKMMKTIPRRTYVEKFPEDPKKKNGKKKKNPLSILLLETSTSTVPKMMKRNPMI